MMHGRRSALLHSGPFLSTTCLPLQLSICAPLALRGHGSRFLGRKPEPANGTNSHEAFWYLESPRNPALMFCICSSGPGPNCLRPVREDGLGMRKISPVNRDFHGLDNTHPMPTHWARHSIGCSSAAGSVDLLGTIEMLPLAACFVRFLFCKNGCGEWTAPAIGCSLEDAGLQEAS